MRSTLLVTALLLGGATASLAQGQEAKQGDAAFTYHYVRTNAAPGECGCFGLNGAGISGSWNVRGGWSAVTEFSSEYTPKATPGNSSLTLTTFLAGARYRLPSGWLRKLQSARRVQPFAQVLLGGGHSGGGVAGVGDSTYAFAARMGGGVDVPVSSRFAVRGQIDYFPTLFANAKNDRQNNLLVGVGIVYQWSWSRAK
jgi:outer membrane immunogenic protein